MNTETLPNLPGIETAVLAAMMVDNRCIDTVSDMLPEAAFYHSERRAIYRAICALHGRGEPADQLTVFEELGRSGMKLETVGVAEIASEVFTAANAEYHAGFLRNSWMRRCLIHRGEQLTQSAFVPSAEMGELLTMAGAITDGLEVRGSDVVDGKEAARRAVERVQKASEGRVGIATGSEALDRLVLGWEPEDLIYVGAPESTGKTALAIHFLLSAATEGVHVHFVSREMRADLISLRLLSVVSGIDSLTLRSGNLGAGQWARLTEARATVADLPHSIDEQSVTVEEAVASIRMAARRGAGLAIVDYLQLLAPRTGRSFGNREQEVADMSGMLKGVARRGGIPVIVLAQLNREYGRRKNKRPLLTDFRESGRITQDGDVVLGLYQPSKHSEKVDRDLLEVIVLKQRNGPTGRVGVHYNRATGLMSEYTGRLPDPEVEGESDPF